MSRRICWLAATGALAATAPLPAFAAAVSPVDLIKAVEQAFLSSLTGMDAQPLLDWGRRLLGALAAIMVAWTVGRSMLQKAAVGSIMGDLLSIAFTTAIAGSIFGAWGGTPWSDHVLTTLLQVGSKLSGAGAPAPSGTSSADLAALTAQPMMLTQNMMNAAFSVFEVQTSATPAAPASTSWLGAALDWASMKMTDAMRAIITAAAKVLVGVLLFLAAAITGGIAFIAVLGAKVALALAPVFAPWMLLAGGQSIFSHWLGFLLSWGATLMFLTLFGGIANNFMKLMQDVAKLSSDPVGDFLVFGVMVFCALVIIMLVSQASSWAKALVPGGLSFSIGSLLSPAQQVGRAASSTGSAAAGAMAAGREMGAGMANGASRGYAATFASALGQKASLAAGGASAGTGAGAASTGRASFSPGSYRAGLASRNAAHKQLTGKERPGGGAKLAAGIAGKGMGLAAGAVAGGIGAARSVAAMHSAVSQGGSSAAQGVIDAARARAAAAMAGNTATQRAPTPGVARPQAKNSP